MTGRFLTGLLFTALSLPSLAARLVQGARRHERPTIVAAGRALEGSAGRDSNRPASCSPVVRVAGETRPPDPQPVVTPLMAKAGRVRRAELGPPCHSCGCCTIYANRLHDAHAEITRLRDELVRGDGRRINQTGPLHVVTGIGTGGES
ncbi:MAG: hypothetical protein JWP11_2822 [Frankiales bacterium]|nr:hypothetical protein [Frankiales bacterium]